MNFISLSKDKLPKKTKIKKPKKFPVGYEKKS